MAQGPRPKASSGFTLIEILVVIIIIGILASLIAIGVNSAIITAKTNASENIVHQIHSAADRYRVAFGDYPPSTLREIGGSVPNETNNGIEALVACLATKKSGGPFYTPADEFYGNSDEDSLSGTRNPTEWFFGDNQLREYVDAFGSPLTYVHHKDYGRPRPDFLKYKFAAGGPEKAITIDQSAATRTFASPTRYQIRSVGHDGAWGTADDVKVDR